MAWKYLLICIRGKSGRPNAVDGWPVVARPVLEPDHPWLVGIVSETQRPRARRGAPPPLPVQSAPGDPGRVRGTDLAGCGAGLPGWGVFFRAGAWRANGQRGTGEGGACARVRRAAGQPTQAEAGVAPIASRCRAELPAGLAAALACQAVARLPPRAPPSRSAPSHRPVRALAEAAVRRSPSSGSAAAEVEAGWRRVPGERRWRGRLAARRSEHLPRPARQRSVSAPPVPRRRVWQPGPPSPLPSKPSKEHLLLIAVLPGAGARSRMSLRVRLPRAPQAKARGVRRPGLGCAPRQWARPQPGPLVCRRRVRPAGCLLGFQKGSRGPFGPKPEDGAFEPPQEVGNDAAASGS